MPELRKDYLLDEYVIIANERSKRPDQFKREIESKEVSVDFFAPGNESLTPKETCRREDHNGWYIRGFNNKYPAVVDYGGYFFKKKGINAYSNAYGYHEVIVESPKIEDELSILSVNHIKELFDVFDERVKEISGKKGIKYVNVFKNHLDAAGTSVVHSHSQVVGLNIVPPLVLRKCEAFKKKGDNYFVDLVSKEKDLIAFENDSVVSLCPFASKFPLELMIFPQRYVKSYDELDEKERYDLAEVVKKSLEKLKSIEAPYNLFLHYAPKGKKLHLYVSIIPRLTIHGGFEFSSGIIINPMPPEDAVKFYRE